MTSYDFEWRGERLTATGSGALWWPAARLLCVADLHLGRSERLARRGGGLLPPYETAETLDRLAAEIARFRPATLVCLGDSFDDLACEAALGGPDRARLTGFVAECDWIWVAGNHDPGPVTLGGRQVAELRVGPFLLRHAAEPETEPGEVSGHYHPKFRRVLRGRTVARPCFLWDGRRLILPAFGAFTGGLSADHPEIRALLAPGALAILTGSPCCALPLADPQARPARRFRLRGT
jgi:uncharacterized protein